MDISFPIVTIIVLIGFVIIVPIAIKLYNFKPKTITYLHSPEALEEKMDEIRNTRLAEIENATSQEQIDEINEHWDEIEKLFKLYKNTRRHK